MAYCVSSPTLTSSGVGTTRSVSTTTSRYVTTPPGSVITTFVGTCSTVANSTICGTATRVVTQTGTPFTTLGQVAVTVDVPYTYRTTLYGSSCTGDVVVSTTSSISPVVSTVTSSSAYTSDGTTYITVVTLLSSASPAQSTDASPSSPSNTKIPAIIGGAFGGLVVLALLAIVAWKFLKKPRISFDKEDYTSFNDSTKQQQYHYTPVGQQESQIVAQAFPHDAGLQPAYYGNDTPTFNGVAGGDSLTQYTAATSNGVGPTATGNETGLQPVAHNDMIYNVPNHGPVHQIPIPSLTPLTAGSAAIAGAGLAARPNTTLSSTPYMSISHPTAQQMNYSPNMGYVPQQYPSLPAVPPFPQPQPYGPSPPLQGQSQRPLSHNLSVGSTMSMSTSFGAIGSSTGPSVNLMPSVIHPGPVHPQQPFGQQSYRDSLSGSQSIGSVGPLDSQVLQVMNPGTDAFAQDSSTTDTPGLVVGPSSSSSTPPMDGKGRPLDTQGEKAPIVHLDAGAYGESSNTAPPAYRE